MNSHAELRRLAYEGLARLRARGRLLYEEPRYVERIERELAVFESVSRMKKIAPGYGDWADFLLVTADYVNEARRRGVGIGPARGSAAASVVCYCIGITSVVDPIRFRLIFERFLNPARVSSPDIDLDFSDQEVVFAYLEERYGANRVVRISAPQYMKPKGALRQAGMVLNIPLGESLAITAEYDRVENEYRLLDSHDDVDSALIDEAVKRSERLAEWEREYPKMFYLARRFIGMLQGHSTHPAGVLVTHAPAGSEVPLMRVGGETKGIRTAWDCKALEGVGYVKLDVLNVSNLVILTETVEMVRERHGVRVEIEEVPFEDKRTAAVFASGDVVGIFQVGDNPVALQMARELPVEAVDDVAIINAAIRPGIEWQRIVENKRDPDSVWYLADALREILSDSYGVFLYQEQIMFAVQRLGGFSMEEADQVRRVIATTSNAALQYDLGVYRERFISGAVALGHPESAAVSIWDQIKALEAYCFNKSHAVSYGMIAWQEAYLKARWPAEYLCACLNDAIRKKKRESYEKFVVDARKHGIEVVPPGVNRSRGFCLVDPQGRIVLGLRMILNVGTGADRIAAHAPYHSFSDFLERAAVASQETRGSVEGALFQAPGQVASPRSMDEVTSMLVKAGAFDEIHPRHEILKACFPDAALTAPMVAAWEQQALAFFCTSDPLADFASDMEDWVESDSDRRRKGISGGLVLETHTSRSGTGFLKVRTRQATVDFVCWADEWRDVRERVKPGMIVTGDVFKTKRDNYAISNLGELLP